MRVLGRALVVMAAVCLCGVACAQGGWEDYPEGLSRELLAEKGVEVVEMSNDDWGMGFEAVRLELDEAGRILRRLDFRGQEQGALTEFEVDGKGRLAGEKVHRVAAFDFDHPFEVGEGEWEAEKRYEYLSNGLNTLVKNVDGKWAVAEEELHYRYLEGKPTQIEFRKRGALAAMCFEVFPGEPEPRYPKDLPVEVNRYDAQGRLYHKTVISIVQKATEGDPKHFPNTFERSEKRYSYRNGCIIFHSDSSFYERQFDSHYSFTAMYDASSRPLKKHITYDHDGTYLDFAWVYEPLRTVETRTSDIASFASYKETETLLNEGGLPAKRIEKEGNSGRAIYSKIVRTEYQYTFFGD